MGYLCSAKDSARRQLIRMTSSRLTPPGVAHVFVLCHPASAPVDASLWAEMQEHSDLYVLDCVENRDLGKVPQYFKEVAVKYPGE